MRARTGKGFTLIELMIVLAILTVVTTPFLVLVARAYDGLQSVYLQTSAMFESQSAADRIFERLAARTGARIDPDNHGIVFGDGSHVSLRQGRLLLQDKRGLQSLLPYQVSDFTVRRHQSTVTLGIEVEMQGHVHGPVRRFYQLFDWAEGRKA
jgi:prepilin-type N-terminal cleavage/methylation domain-containing protein